MKCICNQYGLFFALLPFCCDLQCWSFNHWPQAFPEHPASEIKYGTAPFTLNSIKSITLNKTGSKGKSVETQVTALNFIVNSEINSFQNSLNLECTPAINSTLHVRRHCAHPKASPWNTLLTHTHIAPGSLIFKVYTLQPNLLPRVDFAHYTG